MQYVRWMYLPKALCQERYFNRWWLHDEVIIFYWIIPNFYTLSENLFFLSIFSWNEPSTIQKSKLRCSFIHGKYLGKCALKIFLFSSGIYFFKWKLTKKTQEQNVKPQRCIQKSVKNLRWSFFRKYLTTCSH